MILIGALERAVLKGTLEAQDFRAGLGHVHIDGIELLHGGQRAGLVFAPGVTKERPLRPEMGEVTLV